MLGVTTQMLNEVAAMPTEHSWAAKIMAITNPELQDQVTDKVDKWIQETMEKEFPNSGQAERIVRETWPAVMEQEAILAYIEEHPYAMMVLSAMDPFEAAYIGAREVMASSQEEEIAMQFLMEMEAGTRVPPFYLD